MASLGRNGLIQVYENIYSKCQCTESRRITFMVRQIFVWWVLYILYKFVKFPIRHLGLAIGNVRRFSPTLQCRFNWVNRPLEDTLWYKFIFILLYHAMISIIYQLFWVIFLFHCNFWRYWQHHEHQSVYLPDQHLPIQSSLLISDRDIWKHMMHAFGRTFIIWDSRSLMTNLFIHLFLTQYIYLLI